VACGLEKVAGAEVTNKGVDNWLSLLGVSAQAFSGPYNSADSGSKAALQQRVIEMVSSYGYCTDDQYNIDPGPSESRDWIDGTRPPPHQRGGAFKALFPPQDDEVRFASTYQVSSPNSKRMTFAAELFDDNGRSDGWEVGNVQQRQWRFRSKLAAHAKTYKGSAFGRCAAQIEDKLAHSSNFKMCQITKGRLPGRAGEKNLYPAYISDAELKSNSRVYEAMAGACHLPVKRKMPTRQCDSVCWGSRVYPSSAAQLRNCDHDGVESHNQAVRETEHNHGKPGEPSSYRRSPYGGAHESTISSGEHGGNDNEHSHPAPDHSSPSPSPSSPSSPDTSDHSSPGDAGPSGKGGEGASSVR
jgi:hypothetical protein